jgi:hypothetical protein
MSDVAELRRVPDIGVFEEVLPGSLFERLVRAVRTIGGERLKRNYTTTFWFPKGADPANVAEEAVVELLKLVDPPPTCTGMEWWLGRLAYGEKLRFHFDRDMTIRKKTGQYVHPQLASVLYLNSFPSSPTVILDQVPALDGKTRVPEKPQFRKAIEAVANRYFVFPGNHRHGVIPEKQEGERKTSETRLTLLVNYWDRRPLPPVCFDYDGTIYGDLKSPEVFCAEKP